MTPDHTTMNARIGGLETQVKALVDAVERLTHEVSELKTDVQETKDIVIAWKSVKLWAQFAKWALGFIATAAVALSAIKGWWHK